MDAIEATYQNLPIAEGTRETQEKEQITFDDATERGEVVTAVEDGSSFEELISSMLDVTSQASSEVVAEERADFAFLAMEVVDKEIILDSPRDKFLGKDVKAKELEIANKDAIVKGEEVAHDDIPFVELELDIAGKSDEIRTLKELKTKDEKKVSAKVEEETDEQSIKENTPIKDVLPFQHKKVENQKKDEIKKEDKIEENNDVELIEVKIPQRKDKVQLKKLPIVVEDLRTVEEAKIGEASNSSFAGDASSEEFSTYYKAFEATSSATSETSSLNEGNGVQAEGQFASILAEQIKASSAELVERGKIVLQDGNVGEIRLQLKPAHLGNVKIQLKMSGDKKMQGEVTVSSKEAFDAFEESMQDLVASFNEAGFDTSGFNLNWKGGEKEEAVREDLSNQYFSPEKTHLSLSDRLNFADNIHGFDQAKRLNVLA